MKKAAVFLISLFSVLFFALSCYADTVPYYDFEDCGPDYAYDSLIFYFADNTTGLEKTNDKIAWSITEENPISGKKSLHYDNSINNSTTLLLASIDMYDCSQFDKVSLKLRNTDKNNHVFFNFFIDQPPLTETENFTVRFTMTLQNSLTVTDKNGENVNPVISNGYLRIPPEETYTVTVSLKDGFFGRSSDPTLKYDAPNDLQLISYWGFFINLQGKTLEGDFLIDDICMISDGPAASPAELRTWAPLPVPADKHYPEEYALSTQYPAPPQTSYKAQVNVPATSADPGTIFGNNRTALLIISCTVIAAAIAITVTVLLVSRKRSGSSDAGSGKKGGESDE